MTDGYDDGYDDGDGWLAAGTAPMSCHALEAKRMSCHVEMKRYETIRYECHVMFEQRVRILC